MVFFIFVATAATINKTVKLPMLAAIVVDQLPISQWGTKALSALAPMRYNAAPKLAPELTPKTYGPAQGFLNKVCMSKPQMDSPAPTITAVMAFGILY